MTERNEPEVVAWWCEWCDKLMHFNPVAKSHAHYTLENPPEVCKGPLKLLIDRAEWEREHRNFTDERRMKETLEKALGMVKADLAALREKYQNDVGNLIDKNDRLMDDLTRLRERVRDQWKSFQFVCTDTIENGRTSKESKAILNHMIDYADKQLAALEGE
jgi:hypothetical protein